MTITPGTPGQLQWLMILGRLATHAQATTLLKLKLTQKKLQRDYGYILQITDFYWTQSKYYLHDTLIKHLDPFKCRKMAIKLVMTYGGIILISRSTFMEIPMSSKLMGCLQHLTHVSIIYTHTKYIYLYILLCMSAQEHVTSTTRGE